MKSQIGPSGVGKSTLMRLVKKKILEDSIPKMETDPGWIPIVCVEAPAPGQGIFRWKNFYRVILVAVDEPGIDYKINYQEDGIRREKDGQLRVGARATEDSLRLAMEKALIHRQPYTLAVDEFQHIGIRATTEILEAHMDCVKSAVNITKIPWTGFGTYQLLDFLELSPQLSRRTKKVHFHRYRLEKDSEVKEFKRILQHLQYRMPFPRTPLLKEQYWEFCYERSIGNIGTLIDWLTEAYDLALEENAQSLTLEHLTETALSDVDCEGMALEAMDGEMRLADSEETSNHLRFLLGLKKAQLPTDTYKQQDNPKSPSVSKKRKKPFTRKPKRDSAGGKNDG